MLDMRANGCCGQDYWVTDLVALWRLRRQGVAVGGRGVRAVHQRAGNPGARPSAVARSHRTGLLAGAAMDHYLVLRAL